jgi:phosphoglycerate dehydrogenase-like enzyme
VPGFPTAKYRLVVSSDTGIAEPQLGASTTEAQESVGTEVAEQIAETPH